MIKKLLSSFFLFMLTGCSMNYGISMFETPNFQEEGVLLLPVTDRALFTATGAALIVEDSNGVKTSLMVKDWGESIEEGKGRGKKYFRGFTLPEGNYKFTSWYLINTEGGMAKAPMEPLTFRVNKGEVLYVGNFNVLRVVGNGQFRDNFAEDSETFRSHYSWLAGREIKKKLVKSSWWPLPDGKDPKDLIKDLK